MLGISEFFKKIQSSYTKEIFIRNAIREVILQKTGVDVPIGSVSFKSNAVILNNVSQSLKSVIFIKKQAILKEIAEKQNIRVVSDIS